MTEFVSQPYQNFRRAQREGGPDRQRHRHHQPRAGSFATRLVVLSVMAAVIGWVAPPHVLRLWQLSNRTPDEIARIEQTVFYSGCNEARAAGAAPIYRGQPGYREKMDGDSDGVACEPYQGW